ncbi:HNH endonuclease signature motif containing protein, partial [Jatrophihabitans endophyticus]|uniref:HNH endonuclease n=1 Tax=Jatrophihabitans endophyticus TaxID=1206085 RepID=UPI0019F6F992
LVTKKLFWALLLRDRGCCTHPGCGSRAKLEAHHVRHWLYGGRTDLANLVLLCERHHHAHHDGEFIIEAEPAGTFAFLRGDGRRLVEHVDPAGLRDDDGLIEEEHDSVAEDAARGGWCGDRLDLGYAVAVLAEHRERRAAARK